VKAGFTAASAVLVDTVVNSIAVIVVVRQAVRACSVQDSQKARFSSFFSHAALACAMMCMGVDFQYFGKFGGCIVIHYSFPISVHRYV
jgi:hypothetical protein